MLRTVLVGLVAALVTTERASAAPAENSTAFTCFTLSGSVAVDAGHPTYRIATKTSTGLLAIRDGDREPQNLWKLFPTDQRAVETTVSGDFVVCPLEPPNPGGVRLVRIETAHNLHRTIDHWLERKDH